MNRPRLIVIGVVAVFLIGVGLVAIPHSTLHMPHAASSKATYYCPMHPSYTSDRPGDCPICNMKLVKRETRAPHAAHGTQTTSFKDICYLHNCSKVHAGQPCPMLVVAKAGETVTCPICGTHVAEAASTPQKKILYWTDPMIPGYTSDKPGKSPMGMDLVPVYEEEAGSLAGTPAPTGYAPILVTPQKQQLIGLKTAPAKTRRMTKTIRTVGRVMVDETREVHVHPKVEGWIGEIFAKYEGDAVTRGQPLFSFYSPDFVATQQEYLTALQMLNALPEETSPDLRAAAQANVAAARQRLFWWDVTEEQIQALEHRGTPAKTLLLTSPMDGIVLKKHVWPGEYMERGADFFHLADLSTVWVDTDLYEYDLPLVKLGQEATVALPHDATRQLRGKIVYVAPVLNPQTRTATARLEFPNPDGTLRPGMYATAQISVDFGERLAVPEEAILETGVRQILFVDKGQGVLEPRDATVGLRADGYDEVKSGVTEGETVVTSGNFLIDSESRLKAALEGMGGGEHQHDSP